MPKQRQYYYIVNYTIAPSLTVFRWLTVGTSQLDAYRRFIRGKATYHDRVWLERVPKRRISPSTISMLEYNLKRMNTRNGVELASRILEVK